MKRCPSTIPSRYPNTTSVSGSVPHVSTKSVSSRTALFPSETMSLKPTSRSAAHSRIAVTSAPDWLMNDVVPGVAFPGANVAFSLDGVEMTPREFGPTTLRSYSSANARSSASRFAPSLPVSPNPAVMTTTFSIPSCPAVSTASRAISGGTTITASSASVPASPSRQGRSNTRSTFGFTGTTSPAKSSSRFCVIARPTDPARSVAPTTATRSASKTPDTVTIHPPSGSGGKISTESARPARGVGGRGIEISVRPMAILLIFFSNIITLLFAKTGVRAWT